MKELRLNGRRPKIAVVGAGAIGGYVGGHLSRSGLDVVLIDAWGEHVDTMQRDGLRFSGTLGEYTVPVRAMPISEVQSLIRDPVDVAFICTKLYDTAWAAALIHDYLSQDGFVVTMQNGVVEEIVAGVVGWGRTLGCIASTMSVELHAPGAISRNRQPGGASYTVFRAGEVHGRITPRLEAVVRMLGAVDSAKATTNLWGERWSKLVANTMTTALSGASGMNLTAVLKEPETRSLMIRLGAEAIRVGLASGYDIEPVRRLAAEVWLKANDGDAAALDAVADTIAVELQRMTDGAYSGTLQDLRKGRRTEVDFMNGFVAREGKARGIDTPTHHALTSLIKRMEAGTMVPDRSVLARLK